MTRSATLLLVHLRKRTVLLQIPAHTVYPIQAPMRPWTLSTISLLSRVRSPHRAAAAGVHLQAHSARRVQPQADVPRVLPRAVFPPCLVRGASPVLPQAGTTRMSPWTPVLRALLAHRRVARSRPTATSRPALRWSLTTSSLRKTTSLRAILARERRSSVSRKRPRRCSLVSSAPRTLRRNPALEQPFTKARWAGATSAPSPRWAERSAAAVRMLAAKRASLTGFVRRRHRA